MSAYWVLWLSDRKMFFSCHVTCNVSVVPSLTKLGSRATVKQVSWVDEDRVITVDDSSSPQAVTIQEIVDEVHNSRPVEENRVDSLELVDEIQSP
ncbi:hypothetical protein O181_082718 [Austropuccinia psidii MF-1]|uniref:Uncharacterized protein n=1 Tax=Austropuccinia psidii MF-1 TaxID=1389203 RepID=A0A9Q3FN10_9BASI|nr:hypothetical protein [Austropuccinia psidii MF-1]